MSKDLMHRQAIEDLVHRAYDGMDAPGAPARSFYEAADLAGLPSGAVEWGLGVGNPLPAAALRPGEVVVDLGSGAGLDTLIAARAVAPGGRVTGVDFSDVMTARAAAHAAEAGIGNADFVTAPMDALPMPDASVDVVISNGAINLAARKSRVFAEARRVLRPGGRFAVADLTIDEEDLPAEILTHPSAWAG